MKAARVGAKPLRSAGTLARENGTRVREKPARAPSVADEPKRSDARNRSPEPEGLRARHKRDKRERLRKAAWDLFSTVGYDETTTRAIAERAGVAAGTVFLYAKDKQDLLFLVFEERLGECVDEAFRTLPRNLTLNDELLHIFRRVFLLYGESPDLGRRFVKELPGASGPNADRVNAMTFTFLVRLGDLVETAQAKGRVRKDVLPLVAAQAFFALYFMALMSWLSGFSTLTGAIDGPLASSLDLLMQGMRA
jgi:AcrR family transcriptional regulator